MKLKWTFRLSLLTITLLLCSLSFALTPVTVALDWYINPDHAPLLVAKAKGYFKAQGLDVHFISPIEANESDKLVASNRAQIGLAYQTTYLEKLQMKFPVVRIGTLINHPLNCVLVLKSSGIKKLEQLKGKTIGYSESGMGRATLKAMFKHVDLPLSEMTLINVQMDLDQALLSGRVDAITGVMRNVEPVQLAMLGHPTHCFKPEHYGMPDYAELILISNHQVSKKTIQHFLMGLKQGVTFLRQHPHLSWELCKHMFPDELASSTQIDAANKAIWLKSIPYFATEPANLYPKVNLRLEEFMKKEHILKS